MTSSLLQVIKDGLTKYRREKAQIEALIADLRQQLTHAESKLQAALASLAAYEEMQRHIPASEANQAEEKNLRPGSAAYKMLKVLRAAERPLTVPEILQALRLPQNRKNRATYRGALLMYMKKGKLFDRTELGTYGLVEWGNEPRSESGTEPPSPKSESLWGEPISPKPSRVEHTASSVRAYTSRLKPGGATHQAWQLFRLKGGELTIAGVLAALDLSPDLKHKNRFRTALGLLEQSGVLERVRPGVFRLRDYTKPVAGSTDGEGLKSDS